MSTPENPPAKGAPATAPGTGGPPAQGARPRFSETQAAKITGKSRSVIQRARERGDFPNAVRLEKGWAIPVEDLLAAGFEVTNGSGRPIDAPPALAAPGAPGATPAAGTPPAHDEAEIARLRDELKAREVELAAEKARREVLEQSAADARRAFESYQAQLERSFRLIEAAQADAAKAREEAREAVRPRATPAEGPAAEVEMLAPAPEPPPSVPEPLPEQHKAPEPEPETLGGRFRRWFGG